MQNNECCPEFHPEKWDEKTYQWDKKKFIKESMPTLFHIPFFPMIGMKITKMWKAAQESNSVSKNNEDILILFRDPTPFKSEIYLTTEKIVPNSDNIELSGTFASKVFDGAYNAVPKFIKEMDEYLLKTGKKANDYYIHYAYCPKCIKKYGHNYMILFAKID